MFGGGPLIGGGAPRPIAPGIGGIPPGIILGGGPPIIGARGTPLPIGAICCCAGPPTPRTGPCRPAGTEDILTGTPLPEARPIPGPGAAPGSGTRGKPSSGGGGPSTVSETIFSPRNNTNPNTRFSSLSGTFAFLERIFRNSSQSPRIRFMCLSKALKVPINVRES
ncbi:hypothetical protein CVS40_6350 [Lucilia cuprina]|nr:hypothetical protein CVS40_6350 [Lucilia cuprina]